MSSEITSLLSSGQLARLIPIVADSKKEERATSTLLSTFMVVPIFAMDVFSDAGAPVGKKSRIKCYTEVTFKSSEKGRTPRPDGLVVINNGQKVWTALIESKIGNNELTNAQVEEYLNLAKQYKINALITISNQFATTPTHHPLKIAKSRIRSIELYHFSWLSLKSKAVLLTGMRGVDDPEQAYILSELVRYLDHESSGITSLTKMPTLWKDLCNSIQNGTSLNKNTESVVESVSGWHQLLRHLSLNLSMAIGQLVDISLSRAREKDAELNFQKDCAYLSKEYSANAAFNIPNAASRLELTADFMRKTINLSMRLDAPKDKAKATACINWFTRQFKGKSYKAISVRAYWPKRIPMTMATLENAIDNPSLLIPENVKDLPTYLEVVRVIDLGARFKGAKTFVEDVSKEFPRFYHDVGQHLDKWVAKAPKIKDEEQVVSAIPTIFSEVKPMSDAFGIQYCDVERENDSEN